MSPFISRACFSKSFVAFTFVLLCHLLHLFQQLLKEKKRRRLVGRGLREAGAVRLGPKTVRAPTAMVRVADDWGLEGDEHSAWYRAE